VIVVKARRSGNVRPLQKSLLESEPPPRGTKINAVPSELLNHLYRGPIEEVLAKLPDNSVDCIFADPDYNVGVTYQGKNYTVELKEYLKSCINWSKECYRVLKPDGNFWIINYPKNNAYLRVRYLDKAFDRVYEYAWVYRTNIGQGPTHFTTAHRSILHCVKRHPNRFYKDAVALPYQNPSDRRIKALLAEGSAGRMPYSWVDYQPEEEYLSWFEKNLVKNVSRSKSFHSCQIPQSLSRLLIKASTRPGDTVLVLFGGAGSELVVCQEESRNWVSAELVSEYCDLIEERLKLGGKVPESKRMLHLMHSKRNGSTYRVKPLTDMP
jgi:site-specific DNA-methyltransferase (adenine-specific)